MNMADNTTPGWADLLTMSANYGSTLSADEAARLEKAANNITSSILDGLAAIGELQWRASQYTDAPVDATTVFVLGDFQSTLANLVMQLRCIESDANFHRHKLELSEANGTTA